LKAKKLPGLQIDSPTVKTKGANFKPDTWPPTDDFPVVVAADGEVVSRFGDVRWDLSPWAGHTLSIYFGNGPGQGKKVDPENASFLRKIVGWWIWGYGGVPSAKALVFRFESIKPLFVACSDNGVLITELSKFPKVIEDVANYYPSRGDRLISYLHILHYSRAELGFSILDDDGLKFLATVLPKHQKTQTAYIPARIWSYQVSRLRKCLEDYIKHQDKIENCFKFCLEAYAKNAGGRLSDAFGGLGLDAPFRNVSSDGKENQGKVFYGSFENTARRFEILNLLNRWVLLNDQNGVAAISSYLSLISTVGLAYVLSFSLMRVSEGAQLRTDCLEVEHDDISGEIHLLKGVSSKTVEDNNAYWITAVPLTKKEKA